jgi:S1-C subfamily serine protease
VTDQGSWQGGSWQGSHAGMPPPPGWQPQPQGPAGGPDRGPRRWPALLTAAFLAGALIVGSWAAISLTHSPVSRLDGMGGGSQAQSGTPTAGIVDVNTFGRTLNSQNNQLVPLGAGTGMVLTADGEVLTNNHVVQGAWKIQAEVPGGDTYTATVVGADPTHDVALLQLQDASGLTTIAPGDPTSVTVGDRVQGVGNALGHEGPPSVATGSITGLNRSITAQDPSGTAEKLTGMIQTDANILPGDSGGALVDSDGQVVGMITAGSDQNSSGTGRTTGFAIPIDTAMTVVDQIHSGGGGTVLMGERGYLGVGVRPLDPTIAQRFGVTSGAMVVGLDAGGPAQRSGMTAPAVIRSIDGQPVTSAESLGPLLHSHTPGQSATVTWVDASGTHTQSIQLIAGPAV